MKCCSVGCILLVIGSLLGQCSSGASNKLLQLFENCTIQVFMFKNIKHPEVFMINGPFIIENVDIYNTSSNRYSSSKPKERNQNFYSTKLNCHVAYIDLTIEQKSSLVIHSIITSFSLFREDPTIVFFYDHSILNSQYPAYLSYFPLHLYTVTSIFLHYKASSSAISVICHTCRPTKSPFGEATVPIPSTINSFEDILVFWFEIHKNQNKVRIMHSHLPMKHSTCSMYTDGLHVSVKLCVPLLLSKKYNYSISLLPVTPDGSYASASNNFIIHPQQFYDSFISPEITSRTSWVPHGIQYDSYTFQIYAEPSVGNFAAILMPVDAITWILALLSIFITAIISFLIIGNTKSFSDHIFRIIPILLDQPFKFIGDSILGNASSLVVLGFWLIFSYFIGSFYKSAMFSCLTAKVVPNVPTTFHDLVDAKHTIPIFTSSYHFFKDENGTVSRRSAVKTLMSEMLPVLSKNYVLYKDFEKFQDVPTFIGQAKFEFATNASLKWPLEYGKTNNILPKIIAMVDRDMDLRQIASLISIYNRYVPLENNKLNIYARQTPWLVTRNYFSVIFEKEIIRLVESGNYKNWNKLFETVMLLSHITVGVHIYAKRNITLSNFVNYGQFFQKKIGERTTVEFAEFDVITLKMLETPFVICFWLVSLCIVVLCIELCARKKGKVISKIVW